MNKTTLVRELVASGLSPEQAHACIRGEQDGLELPKELQAKVDEHVRRATTRMVRWAKGEDAADAADAVPGTVLYPKYKLVTEGDWSRVIYTRDIPCHGIHAGDRGGLVAGPQCLSQDGDCAILGDARVLTPWAAVTGDALVTDRAVLAGHATVSGGAVVSGDATIGEYARVDGFAIVMGHAHVRGNAVVDDHAVVADYGHVSGDARISGYARVDGSAWAFGRATVSGIARITGNARISWDATVAGTATISGDAIVSDTAMVSGTAWVADGSIVRGHTAINSGVFLSAWIERQGHIVKTLGGTVYRGLSGVKGKTILFSDRNGRTNEVDALIPLVGIFQRLRLQAAAFWVNGWM